MTAPHLGPGHSVAGRYTIRALLGFTGEVATYHAVASDGREAVVKLFDPAIGQRADVMAQLDRVRSQVARLPPDGVVPVWDSGYDAGTGAPFIATEHLRIPSLARLVETGPLSPEVVAAILRGVGRVLDGAHALGLHHHALKPTNLFVGPAPHYTVRLTDFEASIVRRTTPATHEVYSQSAPWWAPEQLHPAAVLGPATDVFAVSLIAFYALCARSYWVSCQSHQPDLPNWQIEVMGQRVPASQRARELGTTLNPIFDVVFGRALSNNQPDRPQLVSELANIMTSVCSYGSEEVGPKTLAFPALGYPPGAFEPSQSSGAYGGDVGRTASSDQGGSYTATHGGFAGAVTPAPSESPATAGLPPFPQPVRKRDASPMMPIIIGVVAAVLIGGGGVAFLFMRTSPETAPAAASASNTEQTAVAASNGAPAPDPSPSPNSSPDPVAPSPAPEKSAEAEDAGAPESETVAVWFKCDPQCDRIEIDGKVVDKPDKAQELPPGKHKIRLIKTGYLIHAEDVDVAAGAPVEKTVKLIKIVVPPPSNKCGQFLCP